MQHSCAVIKLNEEEQEIVSSNKNIISYKAAYTARNEPLKGEAE
jgi:hypothetical protein